MFISVVIPVYNVERYIKDCIEALIEQDYQKDKYEIIFVDNGSSDYSVDIIRRYPQATLIFENKKGAYAARNLGIDHARGCVIAFIDPDCIPATDWLKNIGEAMESRETKIVLGSRRSANESYVLTLIDAYENSKKEFVLNSDTPELYFGYTNNMAIRSELFDEIGPFVEIARGSDTVFVNSVVCRFSCTSVRYSPDIRVRHMEIKSAIDYYRKQFIFGQSSKQYSQIINSRPLNYKENFMIFHMTTCLHRFKYSKSLFLFFLLTTGKLFWILGRISGNKRGFTVVKKIV